MKDFIKYTQEIAKIVSIVGMVGILFLLIMVLFSIVLSRDTTIHIEFLPLLIWLAITIYGDWNFNLTKHL